MYSEKFRDRAARALVESCPAQKVSTMLYIVLKKYPMLAGTASLFKWSTSDPSARSVVIFLICSPGYKDVIIA
jgi:hypothetical protein